MSDAYQHLPVMAEQVHVKQTLAQLACGGVSIPEVKAYSPDLRSKIVATVAFYSDFHPIIASAEVPSDLAKFLIDCYGWQAKGECS
jgi:hypothetical protein